MIVDIVPIKSEFLNKNREIEKREQNIIIFGDKDMINYINKEKGKQVGLDCTFKIILWSFKSYKLMTIYKLDEKENNNYIFIISNIACDLILESPCLIFLNFKDIHPINISSKQSVVPIFSQLKFFMSKEVKAL